ncbi:hypothetical protein EYF80_021476 [Liparis tanakae]|uniref:Uncharacterized protein n=1 Tax=Liparis tanakae TaxID=230148 RepID=A0A4Z2HTL2_9TELE|nr:hypothetical protein EYF80_021476 [Liparis tanakae]
MTDAGVSRFHQPNQLDAAQDPEDIPHRAYPKQLDDGGSDEEGENARDDGLVGPLMQDTQSKKDWQDLSMLKAIQYLRLLMKLMKESFRLRIITSPPTAPYLSSLSNTLHSSTVAIESSLPLYLFSLWILTDDMISIPYWDRFPLLQGPSAAMTPGHHSLELPVTHHGTTGVTLKIKEKKMILSVA